jgi:putative ABC transport system permease protein
MVPGPGIKPSDRLFFDMSSISELHLDSRFQNVRGAGNRVTVQAFAAIAALVLLIACINFAYLTLARSDKRAAEVGIRKILGANKRQLLRQYLGESAIVVGIALTLGLALVELLAPILAAVLGTPLRVDYGSPGTYINIFAVYLLVAMLGGLYPALALSNLRPALVLKARPARHGDALLGFKNMLLVFQFGVAIALIIATGVIWLQVEFVSRRDPGFKHDHLIFLTDLLGRQDVSANKEVLRERVEALPGVVSASLSSYHPFSTATYARLSSAHRLEGRGEETFILANAFVDENFFPTYGIEVVAGRNFSSDRDVPVVFGPEGEGRPRTALINEAAARFLGFAEPEAALGKFITDGNYEIIGVVADNQFYSLKAVTRPEIYSFYPAQADILAVSYQGDITAMMEQLQNTWRNLMGGAVLVSASIEPLLVGEFAQERAEGRVFVVFALFAVFIACLGLYGASAFSVERRAREIGIRRVMGAEIRQIVTLLLWQFSRPVLLANVLAWPAALWVMLTWLQKFPYQMNLVLLIPLCVLAGAVALSIAWLTVAGNTLRVAGARPVLALRYE